ncbi:MAG: hypothetical protein FWC27_03185 [Firmicutes bacterium]|nr:hypothetical protein [Bacillota bacterium]
MSDKQVTVVDAVLSFSTGENDERFAPCVIRIAHAGLNRNKSVISKEVFERNAKTAYGCPIVCNYDVGADYIGGHDKAIIRTDDGARLINMTHPVGYVSEGARYWWETIEENGEKKEYLCVEAVLWKREAAFRHIEECGSVAQSMEISIKINDFVKDGDFFIVNAFTFVAFCLLERDEPAMRSACVELFSCSDFVEQFSLMVEEFHQQKIGERRNEMPTDETKTEVEQEFSLDVSALQCELSKRVAAFEAHPEYPDWPRFCVVDFDPTAQEVFAYDYVDGCACGFKYTVSGDDVAVSRDTYAKKKSKYVDWNHGAEGVNVVRMYAESQKRVFVLEAEKQVLTANVEQLTEYRANAEVAERERAVQTLRTEFSDLADEAAFKELLANSELPVDALTEKAYALRGRLAAKPQQEFSAPGAGPQGLHLDSHAAGSGGEHHPYGSAAKYFPKKD